MNPQEIAPTADFFISYTGVDQTWAEWIAWCLEDAGYTVIVQAWDFRPGHNFILMMNMAARARQTVIILSPDFLEASFVQAEWANALREDPTNMGRKLIPVRVKRCEPRDLLAGIIYVDLVECSRDAARKILLDGVRQGRAKPDSEPPFPGVVTP
jgi:hypothetical protein